MNGAWQVQEAKNKFSQVLEQAAAAPQLITRHGRKVGVLMSYEQYRKVARTRQQTVRALYAKAPKFDPGELDMARERDPGRDTVL